MEEEVGAETNSQLELYTVFSESQVAQHHMHTISCILYSHTTATFDRPPDG